MLKGLKEKRNQLVADLEMMITAVGTETRSLSEEEVVAFDAKKAEIEKIDATIKRVEETRFNEMTKEEKVVETEKRSKEDMEKRALDAFFRGEDLDTEMRTMLTTNANNKATMPLTIAEGLLKKLEEQCPILEKGRRFSSKGTLRLLNETSYGSANVTDEETAFTSNDAEFGHIDLSAYKVATETKVTFELLANSSIDLNAYLTDIIVRRLAKELNKLFLVGTGLKQPEGLTKGTQEVKIAQTLSYDDIVKMQTTMHPDYLDGAVYIMNRKTFSQVALLEDGNAHKYVQNGIVNGKFTYTLAGMPIIIDNHMPDYTDENPAIVLVNIADAYSINLLQDIVVRRLDQIEFTKGVEVFAGYLMADGKITNQDAIVVGKVSAGRKKAEK